MKKWIIIVAVALLAACGRTSLDSVKDHDAFTDKCIVMFWPQPEVEKYCEARWRNNQREVNR